MQKRSVRIVGAGLIGTSIGLALKAAGAVVEFVDIDKKNDWEEEADKATEEFIKNLAKKQKDAEEQQQSEKKEKRK